LIYWGEVPGRDEKWKEITKQSLDDPRSWDIEYELKFIGGEYRLLKDSVVDRISKRIVDNQIKPEHISIKDWKIDMFDYPKFDHVYVIGGDVADGVGGDFSVIKVFDVTNIVGENGIKEVASFRSDNISPTQLSYLFAKLGYMYNTAPIIMEYNDVGTSTLKYLEEIYEYENIYHDKPTRCGVRSTNKVKRLACANFKILLENSNIEINDKILSNEIEHFIKIKTANGYTYRGEKDYHDDAIISAIWALYLISYSKVNDYFEVSEFVEVDGEIIPKNLQNYHIDTDENLNNSKKLDNIYNKLYEDGNESDKNIQSFYDDSALENAVKNLNFSDDSLILI